MIERILQFRGKNVKTTVMKKGDVFRTKESHHAGLPLVKRLKKRYLEEPPIARGGVDKVRVKALTASTLSVSKKAVYPRMEIIPKANIGEAMPALSREFFMDEEINEIGIQRRIPGFKTIFRYTDRPISQLEKAA